VGRRKKEEGRRKKEEGGEGGTPLEIKVRGYS
jgi:hypothetical protein